MMNNRLLSSLLCILAVSLSNQIQITPAATEEIYILGKRPTDRPVPSWSPNSDISAIPIWPSTRYPGSEEIRYLSESKKGRVLRRIAQPKIVGRITRDLCLQRKYMHLRACYYARHPEHQRKLDVYTGTYMCKEKERERALRAQQSTQNRAQQPGVGNRAFPLLGETTGQRSRKKRGLRHAA